MSTDKIPDPTAVDVPEPEALNKQLPTLQFGKEAEVMPDPRVTSGAKKLQAIVSGIGATSALRGDVLNTDAVRPDDMDAAIADINALGEVEQAELAARKAAEEDGL